MLDFFCEREAAGKVVEGLCECGKQAEAGPHINRFHPPFRCKDNAGLCLISLHSVSRHHWLP